MGTPSLAVSDVDPGGDVGVAGEVAVVSGPESPGLPVAVLGNSWTCSGPAEADKQLRPFGAVVAWGAAVGAVARWGESQFPSRQKYSFSVIALQGV